MSKESKPWIDGLTYEQVQSRTVEQFGDRDALVFPQLGYRRSYTEFQNDVRQVARSLMSIGVQHGDHVAIWCTNWPEWVLAQFATGYIGAVLVNVNPAYRAHELEYVLQQADVTTLLLTDKFKSSDYHELLYSVCPELGDCPPGELNSAKCPKLKNVISTNAQKRDGMWNWAEFLELSSGTTEDALVERQGKVMPEDVVNIQYTSGTTGFPKGAMLTHRNLLMDAYYVGQRLAITHEDRLCLPVPFYHCFGCVMGVLMCSVYGATLVGPSESFEPLPVLEAIQAEKCTAVYGVPTMFIAELNDPKIDQFDLSSLRTGIMAGSPCPIEVMRAVVDKMGAKEMTIAYGLTEASPVITQTKTTDSLEHRVSTVGQSIPGVDVKIVEPGTMNELPIGEQGELTARGHGIMKGYYNKPKETAESITPDGWLRTGDLAVKTPDGYYKITGRIKDMIIRGGENIYPREIEEFLYTHPAIADVQVVGLPDEKYGEEICAWIKAKEGKSLTEEEIKAYCKGKVAHYKVPRYIVFVDEYPSTVTGKIQKFKLRDMGVEKFGLQGAAAQRTA